MLQTPEKATQFLPHLTGDMRESSFDVCIEFAEFAVLLATKHSRGGTLSVE